MRGPTLISENPRTSLVVKDSPKGREQPVAENTRNLIY